MWFKPTISKVCNIRFYWLWHFKNIIGCKDSFFVKNKQNPFKICNTERVLDFCNFYELKVPLWHVPTKTDCFVVSCFVSLAVHSSQWHIYSPPLAQYSSLFFKTNKLWYKQDACTCIKVNQINLRQTITRDRSKRGSSP